jgi:pSer/pThr/pTyr-binding forkhead associated (FHA) protein
MPIVGYLSISEAGRPDCTVPITGTVMIGRSAESDIVLEAPTVSRHHAMLFADAGEMLLLDLESTNGTWLNSVLVSPDQPVRLADGDWIQFDEVVAHYTAQLRDGRAPRELTRALHSEQLTRAAEPSIWSSP